MGHHKPYEDVIAKAEHYLALGQDTVYLDDDDPKLPWDKVEDVQESGAYRFCGPVGAYMIVREKGLTLKWTVDFENRRLAQSGSASLFDRDRLQRVMLKLPTQARRAFADMLADKVMPDLAKRSIEITEAFRMQTDSEHLVRDLIAEARAIPREYVP